MSSAGRPEFFLDRNLGRRTASLLRETGWIVHLIADHYADDAADVSDETWIEEGSARGWILLSKDSRIRYRAHELAALHHGRLFCVRSGNLTTKEMVEALLAAESRIVSEAAAFPAGFWHVYRDGSVTRKWPERAE